MIDNESSTIFESNSSSSRLFTSTTNVFLKVKLVYSNQQLTLIKTQITRMIEENKYDIQFLQVLTISLKISLSKSLKTSRTNMKKTFTLIISNTSSK